MLPVLSPPYLVNYREAYAKLLSYLRARKLSAKFSDLYNLLGSQFSEVRLFSSEKWGPLDIAENVNRMVNVLLPSGQLKILQPRIMLYAVSVVDLYAGGDRPIESLKDESVNPEQLAFSGQAGAWVSSIIASCFQDMAAQTAHSSKATDIAPRKSIDRLPKFGRMLLRHLGLFSRLRCLEPLATLARCSGSHSFYHAAVVACQG